MPFGLKHYSFWQGKALTSEDLRRFFEEDITYSPQWDAMEQIKSIFEFTECSVETLRFRMNHIVLAGCLGFHRVRDELLQEARSHGLAVDDDGWLADKTTEGGTESDGLAAGQRPTGDTLSSGGEGGHNT